MDIHTDKTKRTNKAVLHGPDSRSYTHISLNQKSWEAALPCLAWHAAVRDGIVKLLLSEVALSQRTYVRPGIFRSDGKKKNQEWNAARPASRLCVPLARSNNNSTTEFPTTDQHYEGRKREGGSLHLHPRLRRRQSRGVMAAGSALGRSPPRERPGISVHEHLSQT